MVQASRTLPGLFCMLKFTSAPGTLSPSYSTFITNVAAASISTTVYSKIFPGVNVMLTEHDS